MRTVLVALLVLGCQVDAYDSSSLPRSSATSSSPLDNLSAQLRGVHERMHARFAAARRMEVYLALSDLDQTRIEAHLLAMLDEPEALPAWRPYLDDIRYNARQVERSTNTMAAAQATANVGASCGRCHRAIGAHVRFRDEPRPGNDPKLAVRMVDHQWAAMQMWEGLIGPSDERWLAGANALTAMPINIVAQSVTPTSEIDIDDVSRIRLHARRGLQAKPEDRPKVFGDLLATCTHCHALLRDR